MAFQILDQKLHRTCNDLTLVKKTHKINYIYMEVNALGKENEETVVFLSQKH